MSQSCLWGWTVGGKAGAAAWGPGSCLEVLASPGWGWGPGGLGPGLGQRWGWRASVRRAEAGGAPLSSGGNSQRGGGASLSAAQSSARRGLLHLRGEHWGEEGAGGQGSQRWALGAGLQGWPRRVRVPPEGSGGQLYSGGLWVDGGPRSSGGSPWLWSLSARMSLPVPVRVPGHGGVGCPARPSHPP